MRMKTRYDCHFSAALFPEYTGYVLLHNAHYWFSGEQYNLYSGMTLGVLVAMQYPRKTEYISMNGFHPTDQYNIDRQPMEQVDGYSLLLGT